MTAKQSKDKAVYVGADISKDTIDISYHFKGKVIIVKIVNDEKAIRKFIKTMQVEKGAVLHFILEATGYYSQVLYKTLRDMKIRFTQVNPYFTRRFAQCSGVLEKTDKLDARMLEDYGQRMTPTPTIPDEDIQMEMKKLYKLRIELSEERRKWNQRKHQHKLGSAKNITDRMSKSIDKEIVSLDEKIEKLVTSQGLYKKLHEELIKIVGIGSNTACALLCLLPEIGTMNANKISKLAGLAPIVHQSGTSINKKAHIKGGRPDVRTALYMPCRTACSYNSIIRTHYQRIISSKGGENIKGVKSIAHIACMRKLLKHINSIAGKVREDMQRNVAVVGCGEAAQVSPCR